jgi:hypothetical protein
MGASASERPPNGRPGAWGLGYRGPTADGWAPYGYRASFVAYGWARGVIRDAPALRSPEDRAEALRTMQSLRDDPRAHPGVRVGASRELDKWAAAEQGRADDIARLERLIPQLEADGMPEEAEQERQRLAALRAEVARYAIAPAR